MQYVVIGGDAAGMSAASRMKRMKPETDVIVLEQTGDVSYSACGMPYNLADPARETDDLVVRRAQVFREKQGIDLRTGHRVTRIDRQDKRVLGEREDGSAFSIAYDKLLIATGASPRRLTIPGEDLPGVVALNALQDARDIRSLVAAQSVKKAVIIGMGYIALEMAETLTARGMSVTMVKPRERFLPKLDEDLAGIVRDYLQEQGVILYPGEAVKAIRKSDNGLVVTTPKRVLEADLVLTAVGVSPNSGLASEAGLALGAGGTVAVDGFFRTADPDIYAAGDCAECRHVVSGRPVFVPLALLANRGGRLAVDHAAAVMDGRDSELKPFPGIAATAVFKSFGMQIATTGLHRREAEEAGFSPQSVTIRSASRAHVFPGGKRLWVSLLGDKKSGKLLGCQIIGEEGAALRINAAAVALQAGMSVEEFSLSDLAYAPPFGPTWDPLLTAANQLQKKL